MHVSFHRVESAEYQLPHGLRHPTLDAPGWIRLSDETGNVIAIHLQTMNDARRIRDAAQTAYDQLRLEGTTE